jgi:hypothetical protein
MDMGVNQVDVQKPNHMDVSIILSLSLSLT